METKKEENYIQLDEDSQFAASPFCGEWTSPPPPTSVTVKHKTVGGKGVVGRIEK